MFELYKNECSKLAVEINLHLARSFGSDLLRKDYHQIRPGFFDGSYIFRTELNAFRMAEAETKRRI